MNFIWKKVIIRYESGLEVKPHYKGRRSFFDKGVVEEIVGA
jgi:hypothetical protein